MIQAPPALLSDLPFYLSGPMPCPYLPDRVERKLFTRLDSAAPEMSATVNAALCRAGFRRSHDIAYRPACGACTACIPVRIPARLFAPTASQRRVARRNRDLVWGRATASVPELFALFHAYQAARHTESDMAVMSESDFTAMLADGAADTRLYELRAPGGALQGCMIADPAGDGLSAVYSFFAPDQPRRSLGTHMILSLIDEVRAQGLGFVYLGYWIAASAKMAYKANFQPQQQLGPQGWHWPEAQGDEG